jgi:hypothetical protein
MMLSLIFIVTMMLTQALPWRVLLLLNDKLYYCNDDALINLIVVTMMLRQARS